MKQKNILLLVIFLLFTTTSLQAKGKYYALIVGINTYQGATWTALKNARGDAEALSKMLKEKYQFDEIVELYDRQATRANIMQDLYNLTGRLGEDDNLLVYYSGHGIEVANAGYWVPADAKTNQPAFLIANNEIKTALAQTKCKHSLVLIDACFSATIFRNSNPVFTNDGSEMYYQKVQKLMSRQAITAGGFEPVPDGAGNHSVFAKYLLKFLNNNTNKYLDAGELFELIKIPVASNTPNTPRFGHIQDTGHEGGQFIFYCPSCGGKVSSTQEPSVKKDCGDLDFCKSVGRKENLENAEHKAIIVLGASGFDCHVIQVDKNKDWLPVAVQWGNSLVKEGMFNDAMVANDLKQKIVFCSDNGVKGRDIHFAVSSGAQQTKGVDNVIKYLEDMGYYVNKITADKEAKYGFDATVPKKYEDAVFIDIGSGNTKIAWKLNGKLKTLETYGAKYYLDGVKDETVKNEITELLKPYQTELKNKQTCFIIGGVPYKLSQKTQDKDQRYICLYVPACYEDLKSAKMKSGTNIYHTIHQSLNCERYVFDKEAYFTIGFLMSLTR